jgi:large subunit ribosomal protein L23
MALATDIIKKPLITEKSAWQGERHNRYAFQVDLHARKEEIKRAVEQIYKVRVAKVATQVRKDADRRTKFGLVEGKQWKRALVTLHEEDKIDLF